MAEERIVYQDNIRMGMPDFDLENSFCSRLNQIIGISDLFFCMGQGGDRQLTSEGAFGIHYTLEEVAEELRSICYHMMEKDTTSYLVERAKARGHDVGPGGRTPQKCGVLFCIRDAIIQKISS